MKILFADDHPDVWRATVAQLKCEGHTVTLVNDGLQAIDALLRGEYDLVITDYQMPGADGTKVVLTARGLPKPVTAWLQTAAPDDELVAKATRAGAERVIWKLHLIDNLKHAGILT